MATTVVYPSTWGEGLQIGDANSTPSRSLARQWNSSTSVGERVFNSGTGTTMDSGTLTTTPTAGDVLVAILARRADANATNSSPSGWTKLTGAASGSRTLEVWWFRATGVAADKGKFTWTTAAGTGAYGIELLCIAGSGAFRDPYLATAATSFASSTTPTAQTEVLDGIGDAPGITLNCIAITGTSLGASGITAAFSGTGGKDVTTSYYDSTYGGLGVTCHTMWRNANFNGVTTYGTAFTLSAARAGHQALIHLAGGGTQMDTTSTTLATGVNINYSGSNFPGSLVQTWMTYNTSAIPDNNTVTSATLTLKAQASASGGAIDTTDPANAALEVRYYGTSVYNTRGNNHLIWWQSPGGMAGRTLVASYSAADAWTSGTSYTLTSTASFATSINKTGNTALILTTDDYTNATARTSREAYAWSIASTDAPLTIIHNFQASATAAASSTTTPAITSTLTRAVSILASATLVPTFSYVAGYARAVASTLAVTPVVSRVVAFVRTVSATVDQSPVVTRLLSIRRTVAATLAAVTDIATLRIPVIVGIPRVLVIRVRDTIVLPVSNRVRITVRSILRLPQD